MFGRRSRFAVPFVAVGLVAAGAALPSLTAGASPKLPSVSASQLVTKVLDEHVDHLSGTLQWSADLGLPSLGGLTSGGQGEPTSSSFDPSELVSGTHSFEVWADGPTRQRIAATSDLSETDVVRDGSQAWTWDSSTQKVTHYILEGSGSASTAAPSGSPATVPQPATIAADLLGSLQRSDTSISVSAPVRVAGVAAYVLRLAPDGTAASASTVSSVDIAVDAANGFPLRVSVDAVGQPMPALQVGFTSVDFATPSASVFAAPHGTTTVTKVARPGHHQPGPTSGAGRFRSVGTGWTTVGAVSLGQRSLGELDRVATPVSGTWGSGRLVSSSLLDVLVLPSGQALVGFVRPATLEADALTH